METEIGERMLAHFKLDNLQPRLKEAAKPFCDLAHWAAANLPRTPERTVCLRKLLEAMDAAKRCAV